MKSFEDFRNNWLSLQKEEELKRRALNQTKELKNDDEKSFAATFAATYSLFLLAEYHEWINS
ncbi:MAG: hypothetical protein NC548_26615 [Lachnospiraceae bacterium]|nr:hypothetical protein [Lachnospiraceae bacterium]